jgi:hypothetical protein
VGCIGKGSWWGLGAKSILTRRRLDYRVISEAREMHLFSCRTVHDGDIELRGLYAASGEDANERFAG